MTTTEKSTIIKLRQAEANEVTNNGSFSTTLKENVLLEEGDIVKIHSMFLDTSTESLIEVPEDLSITMECAKYWENTAQPIPAPANRYTNNPTYAAGPPIVGVPQPDLKRYWVCASYDTGADDYKATLIHINPARHDAKYGNFTLTYTYVEVGSGNTVAGHLYIGQYHTRSNPHGVEVTLNVFTQGTGTVKVTNANLNSYNVAPIAPSDITYAGPMAGGKKSATLWTEELNFTLDAGRYQPSEIAQIITDKMSLINVNGFTGEDYAGGVFLSNNPFFSSVAQLNRKITTSTNTPAMIMMPEVTLDEPDVKNIFEMTVPTGSGDDYLIGANQTSLNYDTNLNKLNFDIIHFPHYVQPGGAGAYEPGTFFGSGNNEAGQPLEVKPLGPYSGIAFTRLEPQSFWESLGFQQLILPFEQVDTAITLNGGVELYPVKIQSTDGVNVTNTFFGNDLIVPKSATYYFPATNAVATSLTTPIVSDREFDSVLNDEGYYLVEVGVKLPQKMIGGQLNGGATSSNSVQSIIGKYFTSSNFLQDSGDGSIVYQHVGEPQMLNDLHVRVLHPDMTVPDSTELGNSNSIFLEVIKSSN